VRIPITPFFLFTFAIFLVLKTGKPLPGSQSSSAVHTIADTVLHPMSNFSFLRGSL
jgi:hypothetical protein